MGRDPQPDGPLSAGSLGRPHDHAGERAQGADTNAGARLLARLRPHARDALHWGAPRFDVETPSGDTYFFGCASGTHSTGSTPPGWERITFSDADVQQTAGPNPWPGFDNGVDVNFMQVNYDEGPDSGNANPPYFAATPTTILDNVQVNGYYIQKN